MASDPRLDDNPKNANEAIQDRVIRHSVHLERLKTTEVNRIIGVLERETLPELEQTIQRRLEQGRSKSRLERIESGVRRIVNRGTKQARDEFLKEFGPLSKAEMAWFIGMVREELGVDLEFAIPAAGTVIAATKDTPFVGFPLDEWFNNLSAATQRNLMQAIRQGAIQGESVQQIMQRVRGTRANNFTDGVLNTTKRQAEAVVRTSINHISSKAREEVFKANRDIVKGVKYVATLDSRTTPQCFPESVIVQSGSFLKDIFRAEYSGEFITIRTAAGKEIEGTPNHPVLTPRGFLPFNELKEGDQVFTAVIDNRPMIHSDKNVSMPTVIGKLFDSLVQRPTVDIVCKTSSTRDFYGDGEGVNGDISIASIDSDLGTGVVTRINNAIIKELLRFIKFARSLKADSTFDFCFMGQWLTNVPTQLDVGLIQDAINRTFRSPNFSANFRWFNPLIEQMNNPGSISFDVFICLAALQMWHDAKPLQQGSYRSSSRRILPSNFSGRGAVSIKTDNVVSITSEFKSCHVYTMSDNVECYIANGILVKNCRTLDGRVFPVDKGPRPPIHVNCRSAVTPVLRSADQLGLGDIPPGTRASIDGQVPADTTYGQWLKGQPKDIQDDILGPTRGKLFRDGGLTIDRFTNRNLRPLTLKELQQKEKSAFKRAGVQL